MFIVAILIVVSLVIIGNTIKVTVFNRRKGYLLTKNILPKTPIPMPPPANQPSIRTEISLNWMTAELNDSYKELEDQKKKVDSQINSARTERKKQEIISAEIDGQINTTALLFCSISCLSCSIPFFSW